jgi:hypothetical protein
MRSRRGAVDFSDDPAAEPVVLARLIEKRSPQVPINHGAAGRSRDTSCAPGELPELHAT